MFLTARLQKNKKTLSKTNVFHCQTSEKLKNIKQNQSQTSEKQSQTKKDLEKQKQEKRIKNEDREWRAQVNVDGKGRAPVVVFFVINVFWFFSK